MLSLQINYIYKDNILFLKRKKGFSLLELLLVLAIVAGLVVSAFMIYKKVDTDNKVQQEKNNITLIVAATKSLFAGKPDYQGWSLGTLEKANLLTDKFIYSKTTDDSFGAYRDAWGDNVNTGSVTPGNGPVKISGVILSYVIPKEACIKFVSSVFPIVDKILVNDQTIKDGTNNYEDITKINLNDLANDCENSYYGNLTTVDLTFF